MVSVRWFHWGAGIILRLTPLLSYIFLFLTLTDLSVLWDRWFSLKDERGKKPIYRRKVRKQGDSNSKWIFSYIIHPFALYLVLCVKAGIKITGKHRICPDVHRHVGEVYTSVTLMWKLTSEPQKCPFYLNNGWLDTTQITIQLHVQEPNKEFEHFRSYRI